MSQAVVTNYFTKKRRGGYIQPSKRLKLSQDETKSVEPKVPINLPVETEKVIAQIRQAKSRGSERKKQIEKQPRRSSRRTRKNIEKNHVPSLDEYFSQHLDPVTESQDDLTLRLSPSSSRSSVCGSEQDLKELVTAADDNHDNPVTPSKRQKKGKNEEEIRTKRSRASPKKNLAYQFEVTEVNDEGKLQPNLEFQANKKVPKRKARKKLLPSVENEQGISEDCCKTVGKEMEQKELKTGKAGSKESKKTLTETAACIEKSAETEENDGITKSDGTELFDKAAEKEVQGKRQTRSRRKLTKKNGEEEGKEKAELMKRSEQLAKKLLQKKTNSPDTVKQALKGSSKLKDLQDTLMKMREQKKKQQEKEKMERKTKKAEKKEVKVHEKREFAYETLHSLAQEVPKGLPLPFKYKILAEMFRCADTVVGMLFNRQQITTWMNLQKSVKDMVRKNFELSHLGQIKNIFPTAYQYRQEKGIISYTDNIRPSDYQLTLEPILDEQECEEFGDGGRKLTSGMMVRRRHHFFVQLINLVKEHHKKFLATLDPPIQVEDDKLKRWHPQFPLDRVPDLPVADLPKPPDHDKDKCHSAKDVLDKARSKFTRKAVDALKKVAERTSLTPEKSQPVVEENNNITPVKPQTPTKAPAAIKGVSQSLLAKIRAKEAEKKMKTMVRSEQDDRKLQQLRKLPEFSRSLRMLFVTEKKAALQLEYVAQKLVNCCSGILSPDVVLEHCELLIAQVPSWISKTKVRTVWYLRIDKNKEISEVVAALQEKIKDAEKA